MAGNGRRNIGFYLDKSGIQIQYYVILTTNQTLIYISTNMASNLLYL